MKLSAYNIIIRLIKELAVLVVIAAIAFAIYGIGLAYKSVNNSMEIDKINLSIDNLSQPAKTALKDFENNGYNFVDSKQGLENKLIEAYNPNTKKYKVIDYSHLSENDFRSLYLHLYYLAQNTLISADNIKTFAITFALSVYIIIQLYRLGHGFYIRFREKQIEEILKKQKEIEESLKISDKPR